MPNICPVCEYGGLYEPAYNSLGEASYEICPRCGFQFGYDDYPDKAEAIAAWRKKWRDDGCPWFSQTRREDFPPKE